MVPIPRVGQDGERRVQTFADPHSLADRRVDVLRVELERLAAGVVAVGFVGLVDGAAVGLVVGAPVGLIVGFVDGPPVGLVVGVVDGALVGLVVGPVDGPAVGDVLADRPIEEIDVLADQ